MIRLFVSCDLSVSALSVLTDNQAHYLLHVMRLQVGDKLALFNGKDGEWLAEIKEAGKRVVKAVCLSLLRPQEEEPTEKPTLYFAPIKKEAMAFLVQKATELGVGTLCPVITQRTVAPMPKADKIHLQAIEAAEQSERLSVPTVCSPITLRDLLKSWPIDRPLIYLNERGETDGQISADSFLIGRIGETVRMQSAHDQSENNHGGAELNMMDVTRRIHQFLVFQKFRCDM